MIHFHLLMVSNVQRVKSSGGSTVDWWGYSGFCSVPEGG